MPIADYTPGSIAVGPLPIASQFTAPPSWGDKLAHRLRKPDVVALRLVLRSHRTLSYIGDLDC